MCNEWLDKADLKVFERMKVNNPSRYKVAGLGQWGVSEGLIYDNFEELSFNMEDILQRENIEAVFGLDFGYMNDPTAFIAILVDKNNKEIFIFDEFYKKGLLNKSIYSEIEYLGYTKEKIIADCADPKSIDELKSLGLRRIKPAKKGKDSILFGIQKIKSYKIYVSPKCVNTLTELNNYIWENKDNQFTNKPVDDFNHLMDAMRYAMESIDKKGGLRTF